MRLTVNKILKEIGCNYLRLHKGSDYWYFVYDNARKFDTHSVFLYNLNQMNLKWWVNEGKTFVKKMEG